jgi:hypothetical protein
MRAELLKVRRRRLGWLLLLALMAIFVFHARSLNTNRLDFQQAGESGVGKELVGSLIFGDADFWQVQSPELHL